MALKEAAKRAKPVLLEPIMNVEVVVPEEYIGAVVGDINSRRARIESSDSSNAGNRPHRCGASLDLL